jgi:hypothetical protein
MPSVYRRVIGARFGGVQTGRLIFHLANHQFNGAFSRPGSPIEGWSECGEWVIRASGSADLKN